MTQVLGQPQLQALLATPRGCNPLDLQTLSLSNIDKIDPFEQSRRNIWLTQADFQPTAPTAIELKAPLVEIFGSNATDVPQDRPFGVAEESRWTFWRYFAPPTDIPRMCQPPEKLVIGVIWSPGAHENSEESGWEKFLQDLNSRKGVILRNIGAEESLAPTELEFLLINIEDLQNKKILPIDGLMIFTHGANDEVEGHEFRLNWRTENQYNLGLRALFEKIKVANQGKRYLRFVAFNACQAAAPFMQLLAELTTTDSEIGQLFHPVHFGAVVLAGNPTDDFAAAWMHHLLDELQNPRPYEDTPFLNAVHRAKLKIWEQEETKPEFWRVLLVMRNLCCDAIPSDAALAIEQLMFSYIKNAPDMTMRAFVIS
jgi:hypothetical protein